MIRHSFRDLNWKSLVSSQLSKTIEASGLKHDQLKFYFAWLLFIIQLNFVFVGLKLLSVGLNASIMMT